jgi:hypothetical protein
VTARWLRVALALAASSLLIVWAGLGVFRSKAESWQEVLLEPLERVIRAGGELRSADTLVVGCPQVDYMWQFTITSLAEEGTAVQEGEPVTSFDPQRLSEQLEVTSSRLDTARKELEKTRLEMSQKYEALLLERVEIQARKSRLERKLAVPEEIQKGLELKKLLIDADLAATELRLTEERIAVQARNMEARNHSAEARVRDLERRVAAIRDSIARLEVRAGRPGYVVHMKDWSGEKPKVGETVWRGRPLLEIADLSEMEVAAEIAEPDAGYVAVGQVVEVRLDAAPDQLFTGRIEKLGRLFRTKSPETPSKVLDAIISIAEADADLMRPGMAVSIEVRAPEERPVMQLPERALRRQGSEYLVEVQGQGPVAVTLGARWNGRVVVESGLAPGDRVRMSSRED